MADALTLARGAKPGPTHYDTLGLSNSATRDEVVQAFARHMSAITPRSVAEFASLSVAYETLRDPEKRRAYDAVLNPEPTPYSVQWTPAPPAALALVDRLSRPVHAPHKAQPSVSPARPVERVDIPKAVVPSSEVDSRPQMPIRDLPSMDDDRPLRRSRSRYEEPETDWKKVAAAIGWPILGVAMIGGIAGWSASINRQPPPDALTVPLPPPEPALQPEAAEPPSVDEHLPIQPPRRTAVAPMPAPSPVAKTQPMAEPSADVAEAPTGQGEEVSSASAVEAASTNEAARVTMPLSNALIARTIGRIGYACGEVASVAPVEGGASGLFKVTCTSGDIYQASPVRGRYHFRKWGAR